MDPKIVYMLVVFGFGYLLAYALFKITAKDKSKSK